MAETGRNPDVSPVLFETRTPWPNGYVITHHRSPWSIRVEGSLIIVSCLDKFELDLTRDQQEE